MINSFDQPFPILELYKINNDTLIKRTYILCGLLFLINFILFGYFFIKYYRHSKLNQLFKNNDFDQNFSMNTFQSTDY